MHKTLKPVGEYESVLVTRIVGMEWRLTRLYRVESVLLRSAMEQEAEPGFAESAQLVGQALGGELVRLNLLARYETSLQRSVERTLKMLERLRELRLGEAARSSGSLPGWGGLGAFLQADLERLERVERETANLREESEPPPERVPHGSASRGRPTVRSVAHPVTTGGRAPQAGPPPDLPRLAGEEAKLATRLFEREKEASTAPVRPNPEKPPKNPTNRPDPTRTDPKNRPAGQLHPGKQRIVNILSLSNNF